LSDRKAIQPVESTTMDICHLIVIPEN